MGFQKTVNRQYTQGWVGEIINDGPVRAKPALIVDGGAGTVNRIGRAFGYVADVPVGAPSGTNTVPGSTNPVIENTVKVGGVTFFGILGIPKHYALFGSSGDPLNASYDLPDGSEAEFIDMGIMAVTVASGYATAGAIPFGSDVYYCILAKENAGYHTTTAEDIGRLFVFPSAAADIPEDTFVKVPNCKTTTTVAGSWAANVDQVVRIQLTN